MFAAASFYDLELCKLKQKLLAAGIPELYRGLGILASSFQVRNRADAETLMFDDRTDSDVESCQLPIRS